MPKTIPSAPSGETSSTTAPSKGGGGEKYDPTAGVKEAAGTSLWGKTFTTRDALRRNLYAPTGIYQELAKRLLDFRNTMQQGGNPDLSNVLDYYVEYDPSAARSWFDTSSTTGKGKPVTVAALLDKMQKADKATVKAMQDKLAKAGYYAGMGVYEGKKKVRSGVYDAYTQKALTLALSDMIMAGEDHVTSFTKFLGDQADQVAAEGGLAALVAASSTRAPNVVHLTNPDDIRTGYENTAQELTGQAHSDYADAAVGGYQGREKAASERAYSLGGENGAGGTVTDQPSLQGYATQDLYSNHGAEVGAHNILGIYNALMQRLGLAG